VTPINDGRPFRCDQSASLGVSPDGLRRLLRDGVLRRVVHGVYIDAEVADDRDARVASLALVLPKDGVFCLGTASWLLGVDTFAPSERFDLVPTAMVPHGSVRGQRRGVRCIEGYLSNADVTHVGNVPVTSPLRTACDLLRRARRPWALAAADGMTHAGLVTPRDIRTRLGSLAGYPGIVQARALSHLIEPKAESSAESVQRLRLVDAGFPRPVAQHAITDTRGREVARIDNAYPAALVACEHDGVAHHSELEDLARDEQRRRWLTETRGWRFVLTNRFTLFGRDDAFERKVGELLDRRPRLPRQW
jgi:hypothetical protein